jgi:Xaa-Pro aminopeptidase
MTGTENNNNTADKVAALRESLSQQGLDGFIVPRTDEYQGEYLPQANERLKWISGFSGSAGGSVILKDKAVVMSDGRYVEQLKIQVDPDVFATTQTGTPEDITVQSWLAANAAPGAKIGYDPKLHTVAEIAKLKEALGLKKVELVPLDANPIDPLWAARPAQPATPVYVFPERIAGTAAAVKCENVAKEVAKAGGLAFILAKPDSIAWMLNVRGNDVPHTPVALSQAIVYSTGDVDWFVDVARVSSEVRQALGNHVSIRPPSEMPAALAQLAQAAKSVNKPILADSDATPVWFKNQLEAAGAMVKAFANPVTPFRIIKTPEEQKGIVEAHERDGVAMVRFLKWLDEEAPKGQLTEPIVVQRLEQFRRMDPEFTDTSFDTIAGWNANGAIIHYNPMDPTMTTEKAIKGDGLLLVDSGGQYRMGTTDITRVIPVGNVTDDMKTSFTLVLKGHIDMAKAKLAEGIVGAAADAFARAALMDADLSYDHGTGHDVDCVLSVHGTGGIAGMKGMRPVKADMLISNEPGVYLPGEYGIRIENLVLAKVAGPRRDKPSENMLKFETVTLAPIDRRLIKAHMLDDKELAWLNDYHKRVYDTLLPKLSAGEAMWLRQATAPLKKSDPGLNPGQPAPGVS